MAVAADYAGWVQELDRYEASAGDDDDDDPRIESTSRRTLQSRGTAAGIGTGRKTKPRAPSVAEELQQEMKLLNWHKLANEAALKAAIIKTNKIKNEDARVASSLANEDVEEKRQRIQQIIEEEQLRPLQVNTEFFREFEAREQRDDLKIENDVQRHIQHLKKLKDTVTQREDLHRRRHKYNEGMTELTAKLQSVPKGHKSNQDDEGQAAQSKRYQRSISTAQKAEAATADVIGSLDKLMELEKRIRQLEDAGLGVDSLSEEADDNNVTSTKNIRFSKRKSSGPSHEPSRTMYAVKTVAKTTTKTLPTKSASNAARKRTLASNSKPQPRETFLTSLPDNKQRQLRRMTDRERRTVLKKDKATEVMAQKQKEDVVIQDWMQKKKQAAQQRKAATTSSHTAHPQATRRVAGQPKPLPPPPKVQAPLRGAAAGKRIANPHLQRFDDVRKGFDKRKEALQKMPTTGSNKVLDLRPTQHPHPHPRPTKKPSTRLVLNGRLVPSATSTTTTAATKAPAISRFPIGASRTAPTPQHRPCGEAMRLPEISRAPVLPSLSSQRPGGLSSMPGGLGMGVGGLKASSKPVSLGGNAMLPRINNGGSRLPSPPPAAAKNPAMPQFSRLHKR